MSALAVGELGKESYRVHEAAVVLAVSQSKLYAMMDMGEIAYLKIGRCRRVPRTELERILQERLVPARGSASA